MASSEELHHPLFARLYARMSPAMEQAGLADVRRRLLHRLSGEVLDVGAGAGANFSHLPATVHRVVAVEPEPHLRALAGDRAAGSPTPIELVPGVAERLRFADGRFDAAVVSLVLCSVGDLDAALGEIHRVLRPGGQLRFLEHVRAQTSGLRRVQSALDATVWPRVAGGCHTSRDPVSAVERAGFAIEALERFHFPDAPVPLPTSPHVLGLAVRG